MAWAARRSSFEWINRRSCRLLIMKISGLRRNKHAQLSCHPHQISQRVSFHLSHELTAMKLDRSFTRPDC